MQRRKLREFVEKKNKQTRKQFEMAQQFRDQSYVQLPDDQLKGIPRSMSPNVKGVLKTTNANYPLKRVSQ